MFKLRGADVEFWEANASGEGVELSAAGLKMLGSPEWTSHGNESGLTRLWSKE